MSLSSARALGGVRVSGNQAHRATNKFAASNGAKWNMRRKDSYMVEGAFFGGGERRLLSSDAGLRRGRARSAMAPRSRGGHNWTLDRISAHWPAARAPLIGRSGRAPL